MIEHEKKVELDLSNYATKPDIKKTLAVNKSDFAERGELA